MKASNEIHLIFVRASCNLKSFLIKIHWQPLSKRRCPRLRSDFFYLTKITRHRPTVSCSTHLTTNCNQNLCIYNSYDYFQLATERTHTHTHTHTKFQPEKRTQLPFVGRDRLSITQILRKCASKHAAHAKLSHLRPTSVRQQHPHIHTHIGDW